MTKAKLFGCISAIALLQAMPANAQTAGPDGGSNGAELQEVVVTGSRLKIGFTTPTPVTSMSLQDLQIAAPNSLGESLAELPAFVGSSITSNLGTVSATTGGAQALLNLRNLGANRTLVLFDGERLPASNINGSVDINMIPQSLVSRVDVVTGGASSSYGSDAVAGVVNFVLNKRYTGLTLDVSGGETSYGDAGNEHVSVTAGTALASGRLHVEGSAEYFHEGGIGLGSNGRDWYDNSAGFVTLPSGSATTYGIIPDIRFSTMAEGGLITGLKNSAGKSVTVSGLSGMQFGPGGLLQAFNTGTNTGSSFQSGGSGPTAVNGLSPEQERVSAFVHSEYEFSDTLTGFAEVLYGRSKTDAMSAYPFEQTSKAFTIYSDNPYLPAPVAALMTANNIASFTLGRYSADLPPIENRDVTSLIRVNGGVLGQIGSIWSYDATLAYAISEQDFAQFDTINRNLYAAADAVVNPANGQIVCRSTLAGLDPGCVPINLLGTKTISAAGAGYVSGWDDGDTTDRQIAVNTNLRGDLSQLFTLPAGPVSVAVGGAYRSDTATRTVSPLSAIFTNCAGLRASGCTAYNGIYGGYQSYNPGPLSGQIDVKEGYAEFGVPLLSNLPLAKAIDADIAGRITDYSTSGVTYTWKVGPSWRIDDDFRIRATRSQDIRAPDINELFSTISNSQTLSSVVYPVSTAPSSAATSTTVLAEGNTSLRPEVAQTNTVGTVFTPSWANGLQLSVDYYNIHLKDAITTLANQTIVDGCYAGNQAYCQLITVGGTPVNSTLGLAGASGIVIKSAPINVAAVKTSGLDIEAADSMPLFGGTLSGRALGNLTQSYRNSAAASPNGPIYINSLGLAAGAATGGVPRWTVNLTQTYEHPIDVDQSLKVSLQERLIAPGDYNANYTVAQLPPSENAVPEITYVSLAASYHFATLGAGAEIYLNVQNLFNVSPPAAPAASTFQTSTNYGLYDVLGRRFLLGFKAKW